MVTRDIYKAFISSPSDVPEERQAAQDIIASINERLSFTMGASIDPGKWEHITGDDPAHYQKELNNRVEECNFFIIILNQRYGTIDQGWSVSRTEQELQTILRAHEVRDGRPRILAYFRELPPTADPGPQRKDVESFRERLAKVCQPRVYRTLDEFKYQLVEDLYDVILRIQLQPSKRQALNRFWRFGKANTSTRVAVIYPPSDRPEFKDKKRNEQYWKVRLSTEMSFEDYKTLSKIEKSFQLLPVKDYRVYPHLNPPTEIERMNRVWLCLPRNRLGLRALENHGNRVRFTLPMRAPTKTGRRPRPQAILWHSPAGEIEVRSPMAEYLRLQRTEKRMKLDGEWHQGLAKIVAKDYAVLARMKRNVPHSDDGSPLWDYFFAGIRGLGTWGASWFADKHCRELERLDRESGHKDIQLLLEITLRDAAISEVKVVSDEPQSYFEHQNDPEVIKREVQDFWS